MGVTVAKLFTARNLARKLGVQVVILEQMDAGKTRLGLVLVCDSFNGAVARNTTSVESELFSLNPADDNIGSFLWHEGYFLFCEEENNVVTYRVELPNGKNLRGKYKTLTDSGIAALKHRAKPRKDK